MYVVCIDGTFIVIGIVIPGLFALALVICSTNAGEGPVQLVTCSFVHGHWVDVWRSGTLQVSMLPIATVDHRATQWSTSGSVGDFSLVQKTTP